MVDRANSHRLRKRRRVRLAPKDTILPEPRAQARTLNAHVRDCQVVPILVHNSCHSLRSWSVGRLDWLVRRCLLGAFQHLVSRASKPACDRERVRLVIRARKGRPIARL